MLQISVLAWIVGLTTLGGILSAAAASVFLLWPERQRMRALPHLVSFAIGALLAAALLDLLPEAIERAGPHNVTAVCTTLLGGLLLFFVLEKLVLWRHCHAHDCDGHVADHHRAEASAWLVLIGTGFHNVLDGVLMAAAVMTDPQLGIVTALAIFAHEIPQEVGDLAILLHGGMTRRRALLLNLITSLTSVAGGIVAYFALSAAISYLPYAIAAAASSFLYIAVADLIPGLHRRIDAASAVSQFVLICAGAGLIYGVHRLLG
jgi:zinc and cadmium transporter